MILFLSAFAALAATAAASSMHYSNVVHHSHPKRARQIAPAEYYPIYVLENYDNHYLDTLHGNSPTNENHELVYYVDSNSRDGDHNLFHGDDGFYGGYNFVGDDSYSNKYHSLQNHAPYQLGEKNYIGKFTESHTDSPVYSHGPSAVTYGHEHHVVYDEPNHDGYANIHSGNHKHQGLHEGNHHGGYASAYKDYSDHPKYSFEYGVHDFHTGDHKQQWETRDGDVVKGGYTMKEADGTIRVVEYTADDKHGFNAVVKNIGHAHHPQGYSLDPRTNEHGRSYGDLKNYAGAYTNGDYYKKGATSYANIWKKN